MAIRRRLSLVSPLVIAAAMLCAAGAKAQSHTAPHTVREVVVEAPEVVHETLGRTSSGGIDELISVAHHVSFSDLDLSKTADAAELQARVKGAATRGCEQLKRLYPLGSHDPDCVKKAVAHAMPQVKAAMALR